MAALPEHSSPRGAFGTRAAGTLCRAVVSPTAPPDGDCASVRHPGVDWTEGAHEGLRVQGAGVRCQGDGCEAAGEVPDFGGAAARYRRRWPTHPVRTSCGATRGRRVVAQGFG